MSSIIRLLKGEIKMSEKDYENFQKGSAIHGSDALELSRWCMDDEEDARRELNQYRCRYHKLRGWVYIEEYALEFLSDSKSTFCLAEEETLPDDYFNHILSESKMKLKEFSEYFGIPYRTVQDWKAERRKCPEYLLSLMEYKLKHENIIK